MFSVLSSESLKLDWGRAEMGRTRRNEKQIEEGAPESFNKHSLSTYYVPGVILGAGVIAVDKTANALRGDLIPTGKAEDKQGGK